MPADFESGFFYREPAWHGMGNVLGDYPDNWDDARKAAGLDWEPVSAPSFGYKGITADGGVTYDPEEAVSGDFFKDGNKKRIVRSDTGVLLAVPDQQYTIINHAEMGEIFTAILEQPNVKYETAVCLSGGRKVAACVRLDEPITIPGDDSQTYPLMAVTNRHDGEGACRAQSTTIRVVCSNTFAAAEAEADRSGTVFTFVHGKNWRDRLEEARQAIRGLQADFSEYVDFASHLTKIRFTKSQTELFLAEFIPAPAEAIAVSERVRGNIESARETVRKILAGPTVPDSLRDTGYAHVQAAGEYLDWYRGYRTKESLMGRQLLKPEKRKTAAVHLVEAIAAGN